MLTRTLTLLLLHIVFLANAQTIPPGQRIDWSVAGLEKGIKAPTRQVNVTDFGASGNAREDDHQAIVNAINSLNGMAGTVYFPKGKYLVSKSIQLPDSIVLKGEAADSTELLFDLNGRDNNCINIEKSQNGTFVQVVSGFTQGSRALELTEGASFKNGDMAELRQRNGSWDTKPATWANYSVGQLIFIDSVAGNKLYFKNPLRIDYDAALQVEIRQIQPITNVGIECLKISRLDSPATGGPYNIHLRYAKNCWVKGVESNKSIGSHILADASTNLEIRGCYIHHASTYNGSSTRGYGITLIQHTGETLVENNILSHLRHAMMVKQGANGNVFGYNYSFEPIRSESPSNAGGDISLHGHFPFANLFEGNIVQNIHIDQAWGPSGPFNTFFRNRAELYGILMSSGSVNSDRQNFVGNEVTNTGFFMGNYVLAGSEHYTYGNNVRGNIQPSGTNYLTDSSYYLQTKPDFWSGVETWPSIGMSNTPGSGTVPAQKRFQEKRYTQCEVTSSHQVITNTQLNQSLTPVQLVPNPFKNQVYFTATLTQPAKFTLVLHEVSGKVLWSDTIDLVAGNNKVALDLPAALKSGLYFMKVEGSAKSYTIKLLKE